MKFFASIDPDQTAPPLGGGAEGRNSVAAPAEFLNTVLAQMSDGISVFDHDLRLTAWNDRFADIAGIDREFLRPGTKLRDIVLAQAKAGEFGPCDPETEADRRLNQQWRTATLVVERERPNGRIIEVRRNPVPIGFVTTYIDVTERRLAERAAEAERRLFATVLANTGQGFWYIDTEGRTIDVNPAMCRILGRDRSEILGKSVLDVVDEENAKIFRARLEIGRQGIYSPYEIALTRPTGEQVFCINNPVPILDDRGRRIGSVGLWTDISELKRAEQALRDLNTTLERHVEARTAELAEARANLDDALESTQHAVLLYDKDDRVVLFNR